MQKSEFHGSFCGFRPGAPEYCLPFFLVVMCQEEQIQAIEFPSGIAAIA